MFLSEITFQKHYCLAMLVIKWNFYYLRNCSSARSDCSWYTKSNIDNYYKNLTYDDINLQNYLFLFSKYCSLHYYTTRSKTVSTVTISPSSEILTLLGSVAGTLKIRVWNRLTCSEILNRYFTVKNKHSQKLI